MTELARGMNNYLNTASCAVDNDQYYVACKD